MGLSQKSFIHELHEFTRMLYSDKQQNNEIKFLSLVIIRVIRGLLRQPRGVVTLGFSRLPILFSLFHILLHFKKFNNQFNEKSKWLLQNAPRADGILCDGIS